MPRCAQEDPSNPEDARSKQGDSLCTPFSSELASQLLSASPSNVQGVKLEANGLSFEFKLQGNHEHKDSVE